MLALRKRWRALGAGRCEFLQPDNRKILAFVRRYEDETILVVANLSRFPQPVELDLSAFKGRTPIELFGRNAFPTIGQGGYPLTLSPHAVFWLSLEPTSSARLTDAGSAETAPLEILERWDELLGEEERLRLERHLPAYLAKQRWYRGGGREIRAVRLHESVEVPMGPSPGYVAMVGVEYAQGDPEDYLLFLTVSTGAAAEKLQREQPDAVLTPLQTASGTEPMVLHDALYSREFCAALFEAFVRRRKWKGIEGELEISGSQDLRSSRNGALAALEAAAGKFDQGNSSVIFGDQYILKLFRRVEPGPHPEQEIGRFLTARKFPASAPLAGAMEYHRESGEEICLGLLSRFIPRAESAWGFTLDHLARYFERVRTLPRETVEDGLAGASWQDRIERAVPEPVAGVVGTYLELARLLGQRTGELHMELASDPRNKEFAPEPFTPYYQRSLYQSIRNLMVQNFQLLRQSLKSVPEAVRPQAEQVLAAREQIVRRLRILYETPLTAMRFRCHGSYHLGQVLYTGKDFVIIDFEGELSQPLSERRIKRSGLRDVASMIRSFDFAAHAALLHQVDLGSISREQLAAFEPWTRFWHRWVSVAFLKAYVAATAPAGLLPRSRRELAVLLEAYLLEKTGYEIAHELTHRPDWLKLPLQAILDLANTSAPEAAADKTSGGKTQA